MNSYIITGVPYRGAFMGTRLSTSAATSIHSILDYYKDTQYSLDDINFKLGYSYYEREQHSAAGDKIRTFFERYGYKTETFSINSIDDLKPYIQQNIPVIVAQRLAVEAPDFVQTMRLAIGYSDTDQNVTFHDNNFGNNFIMSYDTFDILNLESSHLGLVVHPIRKIKPDPTEYPARLSIMDDPDLVDVQIAWTTADALLAQVSPELPSHERTKLYEKMAEQWESVVYGEGFEKLHPAGRFVSSFLLARIYTNELGRHQDAMMLFQYTTTRLSENYNFKEPFGDWERQEPEVYDDPWWKTAGWLGLGVSAIRANELNIAEEAFKKVQEYDPTNEDALSFFDGSYTFAAVKK